MTNKSQQPDGLPRDETDNSPAPPSVRPSVPNFGQGAPRVHFAQKFLGTFLRPSPEQTRSLDLSAKRAHERLDRNEAMITLALSRVEQAMYVHRRLEVVVDFGALREQLHAKLDAVAGAADDPLEVESRHLSLRLSLKSVRNTLRDHQPGLPNRYAIGLLYDVLAWSPTRLLTEPDAVEAVHVVIDKATALDERPNIVALRTELRRAGFTVAPMPAKDPCD